VCTRRGGWGQQRGCLPFDGVLEVGLADGAVIEEYGGTGAVLPSHGARILLQTHTKIVKWEKHPRAEKHKHVQ
jgi:hypothetical protein